mmetsp:Transcript_120446/g.384562  ORF Transcript_120446/g.384562 Transcript_120446/m.384562 type:complete len:237 (-) Transcript_120446:845-1555(-)
MPHSAAALASGPAAPAAAPAVASLAASTSALAVSAASAALGVGTSSVLVFLLCVAEALPAANLSRVPALQARLRRTAPLPRIPLRPRLSSGLDVADRLAGVGLRQFWELEVSEAVLEFGGYEVRPHLVNRMHGHEFPFLSLSLLCPLLELILIVDNGHTSPSSELTEGGCLASSGILVDISLVQDHIPGCLPGDLHELVKDGCGLRNELLPTVGVVPLPLHVHDLHLINDGIRAEQ